MATERPVSIDSQGMLRLAEAAGSKLGVRCAPGPPESLFQSNALIGVALAAAACSIYVLEFTFP